MTSRRQQLERMSPRLDTNAGLWLDKYLNPSGADDTQAKRELVKEVAAIRVPDAYKAFYKRWRNSLEQQGIEMREALVNGRMVLGLGDESVIETSVTLHRTYGVPYIPGSALKGLAASFARQQLEGEEWNENGEHYLAVFGDTDNGGFVSFYDALYIPKGGAAEYPLAEDVLTVHHQQYYQGGSAPPADWDDPVPVPFLSATGRYLLALGGPAEWVEITLEILRMALREMGVGAKTSSGYGRLSVVKPKLAQETSKPLKDKPRAHPSKSIESEEEVVLETDAGNRKAQVRVTTGEILTCGSFPMWPPWMKGEKCRAIVTRRDGKPVSARWVA